MNRITFFMKLFNRKRERTETLCVVFKMKKAEQFKMQNAKCKVQNAKLAILTYIS
jgi:hypothetical protein